LGGHTSAIGCEITDFEKTVDITDLQHNGQC
jgi:nanoRNase/pAp phosphatase (c-di-AMP/oligoRNAs hydrolase)